MYDGKFHPVDSKEIAFVIAARNAFLDAIHNAGPQILEPIVTVDVTVPDAVMGDVTGNLAGRRARISGTESLSGGQVTVRADMPLSSLSDYHTELKSMSQGPGQLYDGIQPLRPGPAQCSTAIGSGSQAQGSGLIEQRVKTLPGAATQGPGLRLPLFLSLAMLAMVSLVAFANAWPDTFVLDDKPLARMSFFSELSEIPRFFSEDAWATIGSRSGLYRPMLYVSLSLDYQIYGQWKAGYHLSNILLNFLVAILVFGFLRQLLRMTRGQAASSDLYALMAAMIFAAHPVHAEVVNSVFNRSSMLVALGGVGGLWWLLHHLESRPAVAWIGLAICYLFALFSKESAVIIPGLAVMLILFLTSSDWPSRIRKCLPVFWLLLPLGFYLLLRDQALTPADVESATGSASTRQISGIPGCGEVAGPGRPEAVVDNPGGGSQDNGLAVPAAVVL